MEIKITVRYHFTLIRMPTLGKKKQQQKTKDNKCWSFCGEKGTLVHHWWEFKLVHCRKQYGDFSKKFKKELAYDPAISFLSIYPNELKSVSQSETCS